MRRVAAVFESQWIHLVGAGVLLAATVGITSIASVREGGFGGVSSVAWVWWAVGLAVAHQLWVWIVWRTELHLDLPSRWLGRAAFPIYAVGFCALGLSRVSTVWILAWANRDTVDIGSVPARIAALLLAVPMLYLFDSVWRYFGFRRACGADHFEPEAYRGRELERRGIFRYTRNGMYLCGFLVLWVPALWWRSSAALWVALFNHLYIWVHYFATERPDLRRIYGERALRAPGDSSRAPR